MAKQEYTKEDLKSFEERDLRIVRQNALAHAVQVMNDYTIADRQKVTPNDATDCILALADRFVDYVYTGMARPEALHKIPSHTASVKTDTKTETKTETRTSEIGKNVKAEVTREQKPGVPGTVKVAATPVEAPTEAEPVPTPNKVITEIAGIVAAKLEEGNALDFDEFCRRVYKHFGRYPTTTKSLDKIVEQIVIPVIPG